METFVFLSCRPIPATLLNGSERKCLLLTLPNLLFNITPVSYWNAQRALLLTASGLQSDTKMYEVCLWEVDSESICFLIPPPG